MQIVSMHKKIWSLSVICFFIYSGANLFALDGVDRQIGIIYLKNAAANYLTAEYSKAEGYLAKADEFFPDSSDSEYISAMILYKRDNNLVNASKKMKRAITDDNWLFLEKKKCVEDLSQILFRTKKYDELIQLIENNSSPDYDNSDMMYLYLLGMKYKGLSDRYKGFLQVCIKRYPEDYRFALLYVTLDPIYAENILSGKYTFTDKNGTMEVFEKAAMSIDNPVRREKALSQYIQNGGNDLSAKIEFYRLNGLTDEKDFDSLLVSDLISKPGNFNKLKHIITYNDFKNKLETYRNNYTGNIYYDLNGDNYYEELHLYENGIPIGISIKDDQDGILEYMVVFDSGRPSQIFITSDDFIKIVYDNYPYVKEISIRNGETRIINTFFKNSEILNSYKIRTSDQKIIVQTDAIQNFLKNENEIHDNSIKIEEYKDDGIDNSICYLKSVLERRTESFSVLKVYNKLVGNYVYQNMNDIRRIGFADIDFDNIIDLKENYTDGKLSSIEADQNNNGIYDYKMEFTQDGTISYWDFNEDGIYDCRQNKKDGKIVSEYSSKLDGQFDIVERSE